MAGSLDLTVRIGCECLFEATALTPTSVMFKPKQGPSQLIREERIHFEPGLLPTEFEDAHGNVVYRLVFKPGTNLIRYDAIAKVPSASEAQNHTDGPVPIVDLLPQVLRYTLPSRYVDSDKLTDFAWQTFGPLGRGLECVHAIRDWTHHHVAYRTGSGDPTLSATEIIERGYGVCRDLAHVAVALCRALSLPARYTTGYVPDIGVVDPGTPGDFHAYFEVYLDGRWQAFDARSLQPRIGRIHIASGYDAGDCAFTTSYGAVKLQSFDVWSYQLDPRDASTRLPIDLSRRLDGTEHVRAFR